MRYLPLGSPLRDEMFKQWTEDCFREIELASIASAELDASLEAAFAAEQKPAFSAGGSFQAGLSPGVYPPTVKVLFNTVDYNIGGHFASNEWTPPAGLVTLTHSFFCTGTIDSTCITDAHIFKNGSIWRRAYSASPTASYGSSVATFMDRATGTDTYAAYFYQTTTSGTFDLYTGGDLMFFQGAWLSP